MGFRKYTIENRKEFLCYDRHTSFQALAQLGMSFFVVSTHTLAFAVTHHVIPYTRVIKRILLIKRMLLSGFCTWIKSAI